MITLLLIIPIIGSLILIPIKETHKNNNLMKNIALITSLINLIISIVMWIEFDSNTTQFQFVYEINQLSFYHFNLGLDGVSLYFLLLTTFISPIALLSNYTNIHNNLKYFLISFLILETLQILAFVSLDLLLFYIYFESVLPIIFIIIVLFGHGKDRFRSAFLLFLYTLGGSLFMLLSILLIYSYLGSTDFQLISLYEISLENQKIIWLSLSFSKRRNMTSKINNNNINNINNNINLFKKYPRSNKNYLPINDNCKELVIHGSNLSSTVNYPRYTKIIRDMVKIPFHLDSMILGILLSDGHLFISKSGNTLLSFKQTIKRFDLICVFKIITLLSRLSYFRYYKN
jgi:hypothetical protein